MLAFEALTRMTSRRMLPLALISSHFSAFELVAMSSIVAYRALVEHTTLLAPLTPSFMRKSGLSFGEKMEAFLPAR